MTTRRSRRAIDMAPNEVLGRIKTRPSLDGRSSDGGSSSGRSSSGGSDSDAVDMDTAQTTISASAFHTFTAALSPAAAVLPVRTSTDIPMTPPERRTGLDMSAAAPAAAAAPAGPSSPKPQPTDGHVAGPDLISLLTSPESVAALGTPKDGHVGGLDLISLLSAPQPVASAVTAKAAAAAKAGASGFQSAKAAASAAAAAAAAKGGAGNAGKASGVAGSTPASPKARPALSVPTSSSTPPSSPKASAASPKGAPRSLFPASPKSNNSSSKSSGGGGSSSSSGSGGSGSSTINSSSSGSSSKALRPPAVDTRYASPSLRSQSPARSGSPLGTLPVGVAPPGGWLVLGGAGSGSRVKRFFRQRDNEVEPVEGEENTPAAKRPLKQLVYFNTVVAMPVYQHSSVEELRAQDHAAGVKCATRATRPPPPTPFPYDPTLPALLASHAQQQQGSAHVAAGPDAPPKGGWKPFAVKGEGAGSRVAMFVATTFTEEPSKLAPRNTEVQLQDITAMQPYKHQSVEQLRMEDYAAGVCCASGVPPPAAASSFPVHCPLEQPTATQPPTTAQAAASMTATPGATSATPQGPQSNGMLIGSAPAAAAGPAAPSVVPEATLAMSRGRDGAASPPLQQPPAAPLPASTAGPRLAFDQPASVRPAFQIQTAAEGWSDQAEAAVSGSQAAAAAPAAATPAAVNSSKAHVQGIQSPSRKGADTTNPGMTAGSSDTKAKPASQPKPGASAAPSSTPAAASTAASKAATVSSTQPASTATAGSTASHADIAAGAASTGVPASQSATASTSSDAPALADAAAATVPAMLLVLQPDGSSYHPEAMVLVKLPNGFYGTPQQAAALAAGAALPAGNAAEATAIKPAAVSGPEVEVNAQQARANMPRRVAWLAWRLFREVAPLLPLLLHWQLQQQHKQG